MQIFHHIKGLREALAESRRAGKTIAFVPTMGNLHQAHLALVEQARAHCDVVVASIFVNRLQFGLNEDWDKYPRTLEDDANKLRTVGCDYLFCPEEREVYPNGMDTQTRVIVPTMAGVLCGASRPKHFEGVTTVVAKLFNIVQPDVAVFGLKDFQQLAIIRRMVEDLCIPVKIVAGEIVREPDGLAMSSRNHFILEWERPLVGVLHKALTRIREQILTGCSDFSALEQKAKEEVERVGFTLDYVSVCNSTSLSPAASDDNEVIVLGAMYTKKARLIDNVLVVRS